jgi:Fic family protein
MPLEKYLQQLTELIQRYKELYRAEPDLQKYSEYAITYHSTAIEGSTLTEHEVVELLDLGKPAQKRVFWDNLMVYDHHQALLNVVERARREERITERMIQEISAMVMRNTGKQYSVPLGEFDSSKGEYRLCSVYAGKRTFPDCQKVPAMMKKLIEYIHSEQKEDTINVLSLAFEVHFRFVSIHPFVDGNGRTARLLMNYILHYYGFPMMFVFKADRLQYIDALYQAQEREDITPFYEFMVKQSIKFLKHEIKNLQ